MKRLPLLMTSLALAPALLADGLEHATFDSGGKLNSLIHRGEAVPIVAGWQAFFEGGLEAPLQPHDQRAPITREGLDLRWTGEREFPNGQRLAFSIDWTQNAEVTRFETTVTAVEGRHRPNPEALDFVLDLPRERFVGGAITSADVALPAVKPTDHVLLRTTTDHLTFVDAEGNWTFVLDLTAPRALTVSDLWTVDDWGRDVRLYRIRLATHGGLWESGETATLAGTLRLRGEPAPAAAHLTVDATAHRYPFHGYGGNFCWGWSNGPEVTDFMIDTLDLAWSRSELKLLAWDRERPNPGKELTEDFQRIRRIQDKGIPWIISNWWLPERFYQNPNAVLPNTFGRKIAPERWPELLELIGSYLLHLKDHYGAEPDLISFNEPDLGVYVGASPVEHRDAIRHIGAHLKSLGLKTKLLLGDTANPRDRHQYLLPTALDPEAMQYVGALSFHSWFGATPEQYRKWAEIAAWLDKPLLIGEAGFDPGSYRNRDYDSYDNGLDETRENIRILNYAEPQSSLFWQFTDDYGLARRLPDGSVEPTGRYWLMKHFTNLTPRDSTAVATSSDQPDVLLAAFTKDNRTVVHLLNLGAERSATVAGLSSGNWSRSTTQDGDGFAENPSIQVGTAETHLTLPARSLTTLIQE